jgi:hypothetical protein
MQKAMTTTWYSETVKKDFCGVLSRHVIISLLPASNFCDCANCAAPAPQALRR